MTSTPTSTTAARAVRSIRSERIATLQMEIRPLVRRSETVRDGSEPVEGSLTAETAVIDPATGRYCELTARQMTAIHLLTMGKSVVATAKSLEIGVSTLHRWKSKQPAFVAELNRRQHEMFDRTVDKLRSTMAKAVDELYALMQGNNRRERYEVAMKLLPMMQPRKWIVPTGPGDAEGVVDAQIRELRAANGEEAKAEITADERAAAIAEAEAAIGNQFSGTGIPACDAAGSHRSVADRRGNACATEASAAVPHLEGGSPLPPDGTEGTAQASRSDALQEDGMRNARTHAERVGMRPVESSDSEEGGQRDKPFKA